MIASLSSSLLRGIIKKTQIVGILLCSSPFPRSGRHLQRSGATHLVPFTCSCNIDECRLALIPLCPMDPVDSVSEHRSSTNVRDGPRLSSDGFSCCLASGQNVPSNGCLAQRLVMHLQSPDLRATSSTGVRARHFSTLRHFQSSRPLWSLLCNANTPT